MASKQIKGSEESKPLRKSRAGRFKVSIWRFKKLLTSGDKESAAYIEQWVDVERACIQYSTKNKATGVWANQSIWFSVDDLRNLAQAVDQLSEEAESASFFSGENEVEGFSSIEGKNPV